MSNCPHEAWDFGALQCSDCGAVKDHVTDAEYAKLAAEAQALREEVAKLRARVVVVQDWQPLTAVGQVEIGDLLRFTVGGKEIEVSARLVIAPGDPKEEIIYNRGKNHYFITSMAVDGTSSHKNVMVKRHNGKTVSEGLLRSACFGDEQEAAKALNVLRALLSEQEGGRQ